jgi:hypothetical protein
MSYVPTVAAYNALGAGPLPAGVNLDHVEAFTNQNNILPAVNLTCYIGPAFFKGDVYIPHAPDQRSGTGTILHELSHGVSGAIDHMYTWDANYHTLTALQRAENADTYREYCQLFDT